MGQLPCEENPGTKGARTVNCGYYLVKPSGHVIVRVGLMKDLVTISLPVYKIVYYASDGWWQQDEIVSCG